MTRGAPLARVLAFVSFAGFCAAAAIYVLALRGHDVSGSFPAMLLLHVLTITIFGIAIFVGRGSSTKERGWGASMSLLNSFPTWFGVLAGAALIYAIVNFILCIPMLSGGSPEIVDGQFVLNNKGAVRNVSQAEFDAVNIARIRMFSGHWMLFLLAGTGMLWFKAPPEMR